MKPAAELTLIDVVRTFGGIRAVDGVSIRAEGEVLGIIGPNGAGKTVLLNLVNGVYPIDSGAITLDGVRIDGLRPHQIAALGVGRAFQSTEQFSDFRVVDYVMLGRLWHQYSSLYACGLGLPSVRRSERREHGLALETLERFALAEAADVRVSELAYGLQKIVDIARVVAAEPRLMLLDEPTSGTTSTERGAISAVLREIAAPGTTMLVIDHDVNFISTISDRIVVLNYGQVLAEGAATDVLGRPDVIEAYLGL
jgi:branched-chain amino acid transport system ATP-binding protein